MKVILKTFGKTAVTAVTVTNTQGEKVYSGKQLPIVVCGPVEETEDGYKITGTVRKSTNGKWTDSTETVEFTNNPKKPINVPAGKIMALLSESHVLKDCQSINNIYSFEITTENEKDGNVETKTYKATAIYGFACGVTGPGIIGKDGTALPKDSPRPAQFGINVGTKENQNWINVKVFNDQADKTTASGTVIKAKKKAQTVAMYLSEKDGKPKNDDIACFGKLSEEEFNGKTRKILTAYEINAK